MIKEWSEGYRAILVNAKLLIAYMSRYVDDGRQLTTMLAIGMIFDEEIKVFKHDALYRNKRS